MSDAETTRDYDQILRDYCEADHAFRTKFAEAVSRDEMLALPQDVREARALLECAAEADIRKDTLIAVELVKAEREERWIAAHEYATAWRRQTT